MIVMLIKVNAENDANANPRRGWVHTGECGNFLAFYVEGYDNGGEALAVLRREREPESLSINVTPKEYRRLRGLVSR